MDRIRLLFNDAALVTSSILYCGDTHLGSAAAYLAGLMASWGWDFDYVDSASSLESGKLRSRSLVILSDFPSTRVNQNVQEQFPGLVGGGTGLLMIGGWESFHGLGGDWDATPLADLLPVTICSADDRMNCDHPVMLRPVCDHPTVAGLPWRERPPLVGGFNRFAVRPEATLVLEADRLEMSRRDEHWQCRLVETHPMLAVGEYGRGRTAALATDAAPHWVGGFVDWGTGRICGKASGGDEIEVGDLYARFWRQLLSYVGRLEF